MTDRRNAHRALPDSARSRNIPPVPPGSTALREFCHVVASALTLPDPAVRPGMSSAGATDEVVLLRLCRDRARLVVQTMRRILADHEIEDHDIMTFVVSLQAETAQVHEPDQQPEAAP